MLRWFLALDFSGQQIKIFSSKGVEKLQTAFLHNEAILQKKHKVQLYTAQYRLNIFEAWTKMTI